MTKVKQPQRLRKLAVLALGLFMLAGCSSGSGGSGGNAAVGNQVNTAETVDMVVTVLDAITNAVLDGATVTLNGQSSVTDADGLATFRAVVVGTIAVAVTRASHLSYGFARLIHTDTSGLNVFIYPLSQGAIDTDQDGFPDSVETNTGVFLSALDTGTDPTNDDTDGDQLNDGVEVLVDEVRLGN